MNRVYRLVMDCPDQVGIVAKVSTFIADYRGTITEANHHADVDNGWFYMRNEILASSIPVDIEEFKQAFGALATQLNMQWRLSDSQHPKRVALLCSKDSHCLSDILNRWHSGDLACDIACVISNHENLRGLVEWYGIPFHLVPVDLANKSLHFETIDRLIQAAQCDTIVLARYMQILPRSFCEQHAGKIINIHHSFLPSFIGAKPYHQAFLRGVKLIGATCHYVTGDLDAGPIIDQDVARISHRHDVTDMVRLGKDVEKLVLARGLHQHLEDRIIIHDNKTIILD